MSDKRKPKFSEGQVVGVELMNSYAFGEYVGEKKNGRYTIRFWDFDQSDYFAFDYEANDVRPLTDREKGKP